MGAAFDAMSENEGLEKTLRQRNKTIREQKNLILELTKGIVQYMEEDISRKSLAIENNYPVQEVNDFYFTTKKRFDKYTKKKKYGL